MTTDMTLKKADIALDTIIKYGEKNTDCTFRDFLDEIILRWEKLE